MIVCVVVAGALGAPSAWAAGSAFRVLGRAGGPVRSDGVRYAAWPTPGGRTMVLDTATGRRTAQATPGCGPPPGAASQQAHATLDAVGSGFLLWDCYADWWQGPYAIVAPIGGEPAVPPNGEELVVSDADLPRLVLTAIGRQWILGRQEDMHVTMDVALNWHTGQIVRNMPADGGQIADPDLAGFARRLCAPIARPSIPVEAGPEFPPFAPMQYERPFALTSSPDGDLVLERCGRRGKTRLAAGFGVSSPQLGAGVITWQGLRAAYAYRARDGRKITLKPPSSRDGEFEVVHTRRLVIATVQGGTRRGLAGPISVLAAPLQFKHYIG